MYIIPFDWEWNRAEASYREAIKFNSNYALVHQWYANLLSILERHGEAIGEAEEARYIDPLSAPTPGFVGFSLYRARRFDEALREARRAMELDPSSPVVNWFLSLIYLQRGDCGRAREAALTATKESHDAAMFLATLGLVLGRAGERDAALEVLRTLQRRSREQYVSPFDMCIAHVGVDKGAALAWLETAVARRAMRVTELGMPLFDDLRREPGFAEFPRRVGLTAC